MKARRNPNCPVCGDEPTITELVVYGFDVRHSGGEGGRFRGRAAPQALENRGRAMDKGPVRDTLVLHPQVLADMLAHCRREAPHEACGWISGMRDAPWLRVGQADAGQAPLERLGAAGAGREQAADGEADAGLPSCCTASGPTRCAMFHPDPVRRYEMDPAEQFAVMRRMRQAGEELVAIYHLPTPPRNRFPRRRTSTWLTRKTRRISSSP